MKGKLTKILLTIIALLCLAVAPACMTGGGNSNGGNGDDNTPTPPVETYYDAANPKSAGSLNIDGSLVEMRWNKANAYTNQVGNASINAKATYSQGLILGVTITADNLYINSDNLANSSALKVAISSAEDTDLTNAVNLTVLKDGQNRLEKNGNKITSTSKTVATKVADNSVTFEVYLPWSDLGLSDSKPVAINYSFVSPSNEQCTASSTVSFMPNEYYQESNPSTWLSHFGIDGYKDFTVGTDNVILNTQRSDVTVVSGGFTYTGAKEASFYVKKFSDVSNKVRLTLKAGSDAVSAGITYGENLSLSIVKENGNYKYKKGNSLKALSASEVSALISSGLTLSTAYSNGVLYAYSEVNGEENVVFSSEAVGTVTDIKLQIQGTFTVTNVKTGASVYKIVSNNPLLTITVDGDGFSGTLKLNVSTDGSSKVGKLEVNGNEYNAYNATSTVIELGEFAGFIITVANVAETKTFSIKVSAVAGASQEWAIPAGSEVTLSLSSLTYKSTVDSDGNATFEDIPYGQYTASIDGYRDASLFVGKNISTKIVFTYEIFSSEESDWGVSSNQQELKVVNTNRKLGLKFNDVHENFTITFKANSLEPYSGTIESLAGLTDKKYLMNSGLFMNFANKNTRFTVNMLTWWNDSSTVFQFKSQRNGEGFASGNFTEEMWNQFNSDGMYVMIVKVGNLYCMYAKDTGTQYVYIGSVLADVAVETMEFNYYDNPILNITEFAYVPYDINEVKNTVKILNADVDNTVHGAVIVEGTSIGDPFKITFTPDAGYELSKFTLNGVDITSSVINGVYEVDKLCIITNNIVVKFDKKVSVSGKISSSLSTDVAYKLIQIYKEGNPNVVFNTITDANGYYEVESTMASGIYIIEGYDLGASRINITSDVLNSGKLDVYLQPAFNSNTVWTISNGEVIFNNLSAGTSGTLKFDTRKPYAYAEVVVYNPLETSTAGGLAPTPTKENCGGKIKLAMSNGKETSWGLVYNMSAKDFNLRFINVDGTGLDWHQWTLSTAQKNLLNTTGLKIAVIVTEDYVYGLVDDGTGKLALMSDGSGTSKRANSTTTRILGASAIASNIPYAKFTNVVVKYDYEISSTLSAITNGSAEIVESNLGDLQVKFTPNNGYAVSSVTVNGTDVTAFVKDNLLVYKYNDLATANISVTYAKAYTVSGVLTGDNGNNTFKVYKNTLVTLIGENEYQTYVGDNGKYSFDGVLAGEYILKVGNADLATIVVSASVTNANYVLNYSIENDPYALTYTEQTVEVYGEITDGKFVVTSNMNFDKDKYYSNSNKLATAPDPFVIKISDKDSEYYGKYFLYGTTSASLGFQTYMSDDLVNWELVGLAFNVTNGWENGNLWAPEVVYDANADRAKLGLGEGKGVYYMYYSSTQKDGTQYNNTDVLGLAISSSPAGPFVRYVGYDSLGRFIDRSTPWMSTAKVCEVLSSKGHSDGSSHNIDPHPFIDPVSGNYFLYMTRGKGCKMLNNDWSQIDYNSFEQLASREYQEVGSNVVYRTQTNEGPQVLYNANNGKYYMMLSVDGYNEKSYSVIQLISDSPLGKFRKLNASEGGILLSASYGESNSNQQTGQEKDVVPNLSGPGHHGMFYEDGKMFIIYHRHEYVYSITDGNWYYPNTYGKGSSAYKTRYVAIDRVEWVKNSNGLDVLAMMGPTSTVQPLLYETGATKYDNIISDATVTVDNATVSSNLTALTDNLLLTYEATSSFIKEFTATGKVTIKISFDDYRLVTGLSIYNSKYYNKLFDSVEKIEVDCLNGNKFGTGYINNLTYPTQYYNDTTKQAYQGSPLVVDFGELFVKEIRITIDVRKGNTAFAVGEISVLGVPEN